ncbi:MAG: glycosyltransferase family 4 protein [Chitinophagales bacterium]|nr:glycosyltransferase family 4 protein [Chitinophagales bacterium]
MIKPAKIKILFLANTPVVGIPASFGGATVLAQEILSYLDRDERIEVQAYPLRRTWKPKWHILDHLLWVFKFPWIARKLDIVSMHATWDYTFTTAPLLWLWAKLMNKKVVYHFFGGNFHEQYEVLPSFLKWVYKNTLLKSDTLFLETKALVTYFSELGVSNVQWLPNARRAAPLKRDDKPFERRFVFISRVIPEKGISEIMEAAGQLPMGYIVDVYGPMDDRYFHENDFHSVRLNYKGVLNPDQVTNILSQYDVLLLPTWFQYEGYPGIVLEALSLGIPVISTYWNAIPEIIEDGFNGKLIHIKNSKELLNAILYFNQENYKNFSKNALNSFEAFDCDVVFQKIVNSYCP